MAKLPGLSPVGGDRADMRGKVGRNSVRRDLRPQYNLTPSAGAVDTFVRAAQAPDDRRLDQLADALSRMNPALEGYVRQSNDRTEAEQMERIAFYTEQFSKDREAGAVNAAQVKEVFPELVPTVAARIAQSIASKDAREFATSKAQAILEDDSLRLNTEARQAAMQQFKQEAMQQIGDNPFYGSAYLEQFDKVFAEYESAWMRETAGYHEQVQLDEFSAMAAEALASGGDLLALDAQWKEGSSLNNLQRNQAIVESAINLAASKDDPSILQRIPERFLNAESKANLQAASDRIASARHSKIVRARQDIEWQRSEAVRAGKADVLRRMSAGEYINPNEYLRNPDVFEYALRLNNASLMNDTVSTRNASAFRSNVLKAGTTGSFVDAFQNDPYFRAEFSDDDQVTEESLRDHIMRRPDMNPREQQAALESIPQLMEGVNFLRDPDVTSYFEATVGSDLKVFAQSPQGMVLQVRGINAQGMVWDTFQSELRQRLRAYTEDNGQMPRGAIKMELVSDAVNASRQALQNLQQHGGQPAQPTQQPSTRARVANRSTASDDSAEEGDVIVLPNGVKVRRQ